jgi:hypothetical protein
LQTDSAVGEPVELGEIVYEQGLGFRSGSIVGFEIGHKSFERGMVFAFDQYPAGSEAVFKRILAGCGFAGFSTRSAFGLGCSFFVGVKGLAHKGFTRYESSRLIWG